VRLTLATWNTNSVRLRIDLVARFLREQAPHVLCLQETKCRDSEFPLVAFHKLGYPYAAINGQRGYHGVAIASKLPLTIVDRRSFCEKGDARHIAVTLKPGGAGAARSPCIISMCLPAAMSPTRRGPLTVDSKVKEFLCCPCRNWLPMAGARAKPIFDHLRLFHRPCIAQLF